MKVHLIVVKLKNKKEIIGNLKAFDLHLNIWVSEVETDKKKFSDLLIRGDTIVYISLYTP